MKKLMIAATFFAMPAFAQESATQSQDALEMPDHVKHSIAPLRAYGDRLDKAIAAIEAQWQLPRWADCEQDESAQSPAS